MQLGADARVDPVRPDERAPAQLGGAPVAAAIDDAHEHAVVCLLEPADGMTAAHAIGAQAFGRHPQEQHLQLAAVDRELRVVVAGADAARLRPDALSVPVVVRELGGLDRGRGERVLQPEAGQHPDGVGQQVDADAERPDLARRLDDRRVDAARVQGERGGQPADPAAGDQDLAHGAGRKPRRAEISSAVRRSAGLSRATRSSSEIIERCTARLTAATTPPPPRTGIAIERRP